MRAISMTAADLCASTKPWEYQFRTVQVIFEEFYTQVDGAVANATRRRAGCVCVA